MGLIATPANDPVVFQEEVLRRQLWDKQKEISYAVARSKHSVVSIRGCHGSGKSFTVAGLVPYFLMSGRDTIVLTVAPTLRQVKLLWNEIERAIGSIRVNNIPERTTTTWKISENNYAQGFSSSRGVNAQGFHGKRVVIIEDEALGIAPDLFDAIDGIRASGDVREVRLFNPTVPAGAPYEDFTKNRAARELITISAFDTPNLLGLTMESLLQLSEDELDYMPAPHLTRRRWVKEMYYKWGPENPRFRSRVLGQFPNQATNAVFELAWIEAAALPYDEELLRALMRPGVYIQVGLDIAGPGEDETSITARIGQFVVARDSWAKSDPLDDVLQFLGRLQQRFPGARLIIVADVVGIGYYFARAIAKQGYDVRAFVAGAAAFDPIAFKNAKAEHYWTLREWMKDGLVHGIEDEDTKAQLSDIRYRELGRGQIEIEHKEEARDRGSSSPDRAESLIMAFCKLAVKQHTVAIGQYQDMQPI